MRQFLSKGLEGGKRFVDEGVTFEFRNLIGEFPVPSRRVKNVQYTFFCP